MLRVTHVPHLYVHDSEPYAQMHDHIYIGPTALPDQARCVSMATRGPSASTREPEPV